MNFTLPELHGSLRDEAARFARQEVLPHAEHIDASGEIPASILSAAGELGLFGLMAPEALGGVSLDALSLVVVVEALSQASPSLGRRLALHAGAATVALTDAALLTEHHVDGSEAISFTDGELAPAPARLLVFGDEVHESFDAEAVQPLGQRGAAFARLAPKGASLKSISNVDAVRALRDLGVAAVALGSGRSALQTALSYAKERRQFKRPIADFQAIQWKLADSEMALSAAEGMVHRAALSVDRATCAAARIMASRAALLATDHAIQVHGGYGYTREYPVERHYRSARMCAAGVDGHRSTVYESLSN